MNYFTQSQMIVSTSGVGIIVRKDLKADYNEITEKNCLTTIKLEKQNRNLKLKSAHAPILEVSEKMKISEENFKGPSTIQ